MNEPTAPIGTPAGAPPSAVEDSIRTLTLVAYGLYAGGFVTGGVTTIAGLILAYLRRDRAAGTPYASHFTWLIRTFWISLVVGAIGFVLTFLGIGIFVLLANAVWVIYRLVVGLLKAVERTPIVEGQWGLAA
jgi:uncharacterized membrane protein